MNLFFSKGSIPLTPFLRDVLLPGETRIIDLGNNSEISSVYKLLDKDMTFIGIIPQTNENESLKNGDIGTVAMIFPLMTDNSPSQVIVLGVNRITIKKILKTDPVIVGEVESKADYSDNLDPDVVNVLTYLKNLSVPLLIKTGLPRTVVITIKRLLEKCHQTIYVDVFLSSVPAVFEDKLDFLNTTDVTSRIMKLTSMSLKFSGLGVFLTVSSNTDDFVSKPSKNVAVLRVLKPPLHPNDADDKEFTELQQKLEKANLPEIASRTIKRELSRLKRMSNFCPEYSVLRNYLDFVADLPWSVTSNETMDIGTAHEKLDAEHYGMGKLKKRILEYLAVRQLKSEVPSPILCFIGPPGVGKTSIGRSIAHILGRKFQRISLGGVSNQSEIRGHRRTYVGALPGLILQALKYAGTKNPVILIDEIDKLQHGIHGDPKAALLEVLDPEQNSHFTDHYLGMPFDLSQVTFIATANTSKTIPLALYDRMECIEVPGYMAEEKFQIATRHLIPKQCAKHGLNNELHINDDALNKTILEYTREAGVRSLERKIAAICRAVAVRVATGTYGSLPIVVDSAELEEILGAAPYYHDDMLQGPLRPGVAIGLAWTTTGGSIITVEASRLPAKDKGSFTLTGCLGGVMKESAHIAFNWVRSIAPQYGIMDDGCDNASKSDLHIHFPSGAISKEGPSAGITIACALLSLFTGIPIAQGVAMTGEITLQGIVLPVGGIKEKMTVAHRAGLTKVIIPYKSRKELADVSSTILETLEVILVENMSEVIARAFDGSLSALPKETLLCSKL